MNKDYEAQLIKQIRAGNIDAYDDLIREHSDKIYGLCINLTNNNNEADDLLQDVFVRALERINSYKGNSSFSTWLYRITRNLWIDRKRRKQIVKFVPLLAAKDDTEPYINNNETNVYEKLEIKDLYSRALNKLTSTERIIVVLFINENMTYKEIAEICNCSMGTVGSTLSRGFKKLKKYMEKF